MTATIPVDKAAGRLTGACEWGLDAVAAAFLPVVALVPHGAAPVIAVGGLLAFGLIWPARGAFPPRPGPLAVLCAALIVCGVLSALWAVDPPRTLLMATRLTGLFAAGLTLIAAAPRIAEPARLLRWFGAGIAVAVALGSIQLASRGALTAPFVRRPYVAPQLDQVENGLALVVLPLAALLWRRGHHAIAVVAAAAIMATILLLVGDAGHLALLLAAITALLVHLWRRAALRLAAALSVVLVISAPLLLPPLAGIDAVRQRAQAIKVSAWHRLQIWSFVGDRIAERPLLGWGLDSSREIPGGKSRTADDHEQLPLHPHNAALQFWLELGAPGALLLALTAARLWLALGAAGWPRLYTAAVAGSLAAGFTIGLGAYGVWEEWWIATELLALFAILVLGRLAAPRQPAP